MTIWMSQMCIWNDVVLVKLPVIAYNVIIAWPFTLWLIVCIDVGNHKAQRAMSPHRCR